MAIDLTPRWKDFAVYLPAQQYHYASLTDSNRKMPNGRPFPEGYKLTDLDFLNPKSKLWHYGYALYSAGQFDTVANKACAVTNRDKSKTLILGDSGGYQIGKGTLKGTEHFKKIRTADQLCNVWRGSDDIRKRIISWLDTHCDYAMTIDMPIWAREGRNRSTPFHKCSVEQLIELTVLNLEYIKHNSTGRTKWLNVVQGTHEEGATEKWWDAVKDYDFEGWALAGTAGWRGGLASMLKSTLAIRDQGGFEKTSWMHVLGTNQAVWGVLLTAVQRGIRASGNIQFVVSYDSASPFQAGAKYQQVIRAPLFTRDASTWTFKATDAPVSPVYAGSKLHFPYASPLGEVLELGQLNVRGGEFEGVPVDAVGNAMLTNHNLYIYIRSLLEANELAFMNKSEADKAVPQSLLDVCDLIGDLFATKRWQPKLKRNLALINQF